MDVNAQDSAVRANTALFNKLQQVANAKYFSGAFQSSRQIDQHSVQASSENPLQAFLATPKLSEEHLQYIPDSTAIMSKQQKPAGPQTTQERRLLGLSAFDRHQQLMKDAIRYYRAQLPPEQQTVKTDFDVLKEQYRFVRTEADDSSDTWEVRMAKKYYAKLFKEYAIADLSRYKESKVGLRWRTEQEVVIGKGQFACGAKGCDERRALASYEVHFAYKEAGEHKQVLVKVRLCPKHAMQLNHKQNQRLIKKRKQDLASEGDKAAKRHAAAVSSSEVKDSAAASSRSSPISGSADGRSQAKDGAAQQTNPDKSEELFEGLFD